MSEPDTPVRAQYGSPSIRQRLDDLHLQDALRDLKRKSAWLILIPLVASLTTAGLAMLAPKNYTSSVVLALTGEEISSIRSPAVINRVVARHGIPGRSVEEQRSNLLGAISLSSTAASSEVSVRSSSAADARMLVELLIASLIEESKPRPAIVDALTSQIELNDHQLNSVEELLNRLVERTAGDIDSVQNAELAVAIATLQERQLTLLQRRSVLEREITGYGRDVVLAEPTLPRGTNAIGGLRAAFYGFAVAFLVTLGIILARTQLKRLPVDREPHHYE